MGLLTFGLNVTLDGCYDHREGIADDELHDYFTQLIGAAGAMLYGRTTYELMEADWPAVARDEKAPRAMREWARKLEAMPKYVVSASRRDFPWNNTFRVEGDLHEAVTAAQGEDPARRARGQPHALGRARAARADRRVPSSSSTRSSPATGRPCFRAWSARGASSSSRRSA